MPLRQLALITLIFCFGARDGASVVADHLIAVLTRQSDEDRPLSQNSELPLPLEGDDLKSLFPEPTEESGSTTIITFVPAATVDVAIRHCTDSYYSCARERFNALHRLRL